MHVLLLAKKGEDRRKGESSGNDQECLFKVGKAENRIEFQLLAPVMDTNPDK